MKIHEYQAKAILAQFGIPVPRGKVVDSPAQARQVAAELGGKVVLKAQVYAGGRGKAGGIKTAQNPNEAEQLAKQMLGSRLITHQTSAEGVKVNKLLVEETVNIQRELYLSIVIDNSARLPVMMASEAGGMDIEEVAQTHPEKIIKTHISPLLGLQSFQGRKLAYGLKLEQALNKPAVSLMASLYQVFQGKDCSLAEINPLVVTTDGKLLALDAKLNFDDNALFRHSELAALADPEQVEPLETEANKQGVSYIKLDGDVGCLVNGAGLAMATMDIIKLVGAQPANFLDVGGGANEEQIAAAMGILLDDPKVKRVLINIFGGILRCDVAARGIVAALTKRKVTLPVVVRMRGTNADEGKTILTQSGLTITPAQDLLQAARLVAAAKGGKA